MIADDAATWRAALNAVNAWRGKAVHCFASAEAAVSEALIGLSQVPERGAAVCLRLLIGQRFDDLAAAIGPQGPFAGEGGPAVAPLAAFRRHDNTRAAICHGVARVSLDRQGRWVIVMKLIALRTGSAERTSLALDQKDAEHLLSEVEADGQRLRMALVNLRARLGSRPLPT